MDVCAKCGVIVEPGATDNLRACEQKDGKLYCVVCELERHLWRAYVAVLAVSPVQRRVA